MATDPTTISCLMRVTETLSSEEPICMFDRVKVFQQSTQCLAYICLGKHNMFFVNESMAGSVAGKMLPYLDIELVAIDTCTNKRLMFQLCAGHSADWHGDQIIIGSDLREVLLDRITVCWQAEFMYRRKQIERLSTGWIDLPLTPLEDMHNSDFLQVQPFAGYASGFSYGGYSFFLHNGFKACSSNLGLFENDDGWTVSYGYSSNKVTVPPDCHVTIHTADPISLLDLDQMPELNDLRTVAMNYRLALCERLGQVYILANSEYYKKWNRGNDIASWEGWELLVRSVDSCFACVMLRRKFIPPLCDQSQDIAVLLRCPMIEGMSGDLHDVLLDEARFIADSISPMCNISGKTQIYRTIVQARLDALQFSEDGYAWLQSYTDLEPSHAKAAHKFVLSVITLLDGEDQLSDKGLLSLEVFYDMEVIDDPLSFRTNLMSDYQDYLTGNIERRSAFGTRIARYLCYAVDGGVLGERFTLSHMVAAVGRMSAERDKQMMGIIEYLLDIRPRVSGGTKRANVPLLQVLQDPDSLSTYDFNERVMHVLLTENYIKHAWKRINLIGKDGHHVQYGKMLASLVKDDRVSVGLRTLICRQILEQVNVNSDSARVEHQIDILVPGLLAAINSANVNLRSCAMAVLVNLSCNHAHTKDFLIQQGAMRTVVQQLKSTDDELTLYTLHLLVNMTKLPQHRDIVLRQGAVPILVDILTSSYQNVRKKRILCEVFSVVGQLCNHQDTRALLVDDHPVVPCLLWIFDATDANTRMRSKLVFALRQLCGQIVKMGTAPTATLGQTQVQMLVGAHIIFSICDELGMAVPEYEDCAVNIVLLLTVLSHMNRNAREIQKYLYHSLQTCKVMNTNEDLDNRAGFSEEFLSRVKSLLSLIRYCDHG